jgi:hypothetical protein
MPVGFLPYVPYPSSVLLALRNTGTLGRGDFREKEPNFHQIGQKAKLTA